MLLGRDRHRPRARGVENLFLEYLIIVIFTPGSRQISRWVLIKGNPGHWQMRSVEAKKPLEMISISHPELPNVTDMTDVSV